MQVDALERQRKFVYDELNPDKVGAQARVADVDRAQKRIALQGIIDPELLKQRYSAEAAISGQAGNLGQGGADQVAQQAAQEALAGSPQMELAKQKLIDAALNEINAGASLPPDVQNELVQAGLEKTGMVQGNTSAKGFGGQILRKVLGTAGLELQAKRQERAAALTHAAQDLETKRQAILGTLFPNLSNLQLNNLKATQGVLAQSNQMVPEAGLGGTDIANLWLSRVGATNQLAQSAADAAARGGMAQAQAWGQGLGGATGYAANALPSTSQTYNWAKSLFSSPSSSGGGSGVSASDVAGFV